MLGAPDEIFLSLPGNEAADPTPGGSGFKWAYVEVAFGVTFGAKYNLLLKELGANNESAYLFIWGIDGGNVQVLVTRDGSDTITVDLSPFAAFGPFNRVGIGGWDLLGDSKGFDLDAVGIEQVPEPTALLLLGAGLAGLAAHGRRRLS